MSVDSARFAADHREELVRERTADVDEASARPAGARSERCISATAS